MSSYVNTVTLKDGSEVSHIVFMNTNMTLKKCAEKENHMVLKELMKKCKDSNYQLAQDSFGDSKAILKKWGLLDSNDETVHDYVKSIVLNSIEEHGSGIKFVFPLKKV